MKFQKFRKPLQLFIGLTLVVFGSAVLIGTPWLENLVKRLPRVLKPDSSIFGFWQKYPPLKHKFYMFDWKNPEDLYNPKVKPRFEEVGPFVFKYQSEKVNVTWNNNNTITYRNLRHWYFDENESVANLSHRIVTVNLVTYVAAYLVRFWPLGVQKLFNFYIRVFSPQMYLEKTVGELLFDGYHDPILKVARAVFLTRMLNFPEYEKVGWLALRNNSQAIEDYVNIGTQDETVGQVNQWNFLNRLPFYSGDCNTVKGSSGEFIFIPPQKNRIYMFWNEACRPFGFDFEKDAWYHGIKTYMYSAKNIFDNGSIHEENKCYQVGDDLPTGTFNMSTCRYGVPVFASLPHFYGADPYYLNVIDGLNPDEEKHNMFAMIEPTVGIPIHGRACIQMNVLLHKNEHFSTFANVPKLYLPVLWFEQEEILIRILAVLLICGGILLFILGLREEQKRMKFYSTCEKVVKGKSVIKLTKIVPEETDEINQLLKTTDEKRQ